jgi:hypothetical protein
VFELVTIGQSILHEHIERLIGVKLNEKPRGFRLLSVDAVGRQPVSQLGKVSGRRENYANLLQPEAEKHILHQAIEKLIVVFVKLQKM